MSKMDSPKSKTTTTNSIVTPPRDDGELAENLIISPRSASKRKSATPKKLSCVKVEDTDSEDEPKKASESKKKPIHKILLSPKQPMLLKRKLLQSLDPVKYSPKRFSGRLKTKNAAPQNLQKPTGSASGIKRKLLRSINQDYELIPKQELSLCRKRRKIAPSRKNRKKPTNKGAVDEVDFGLIGFAEAFINNNANNLNIVEQEFLASSAHDGFVPIPDAVIDEQTAAGANATDNLLQQIDSLLQNANNFYTGHATPAATAAAYSQPSYAQTTANNNYTELDIGPDLAYHQQSDDNLMCLVCGILFANANDLSCHLQQYHAPLNSYIPATSNEGVFAASNGNYIDTGQNTNIYSNTATTTAEPENTYNRFQLPANSTDYNLNGQFTPYSTSNGDFSSLALNADLFQPNSMAPSSSVNANYSATNHATYRNEYLQLGLPAKKDSKNVTTNVGGGLFSSGDAETTKSKTQALNEIVKDLKSVSEMHLRGEILGPVADYVGGSSVTRRQRRSSSTENREMNIESSMSAAPSTMAVDVTEIAAERLFQCNLCKKTFKTKTASKRHTKVHLEHKPFNCEYCDLTFTRNDLLMKHKRTHTGERPFACDECGKTFLRKCHLSDHLAKHANICEKCGCSYDQCKHMKVYAQEKAGKVVYVCPICKQQVSTGVRLHIHMLAHSSVNKNTASTATEKNTSSSSSRATAAMACKFCNEKFGSSAALTSHYQTHRLHRNKNANCDACAAEINGVTGGKSKHTCAAAIFCKYCELPFDGDKSALLEHVQAKHADSLFECNICKQKFSLKQNMKNHVRVHSGEKPYPCNFCGQTFASQTTCKRHERSHTGERPYKCNLCGKTFGRHFVLMKHLKMHARNSGQTLDKEMIKTMYVKVTDLK
ncbi:uncharacterized protein LOC141908550 [Tubulanus polymorphus]|uniref:uncharacterized protein LOC141908550 n=1 Tax=Tubulanus polymorphus TaxID=672921 RepID=UPI003DA30A0C